MVMGTSCTVRSVIIFLGSHKEKARNFTSAILITCDALCNVSVCVSSLGDISLLLDSLGVFLLDMLSKFRLILLTN